MFKKAVPLTQATLHEGMKAEPEQKQSADKLLSAWHPSTLSLRSSYLATTCLWISFQFSGSLSVPMAGFSSWRQTPATFTPLQTATATEAGHQCQQHLATPPPPFLAKIIGNKVGAARITTIVEAGFKFLFSCG